MDNIKIVFTTEYHLKRGCCCKNGCKHCPYDMRLRKFSESFNESINTNFRIKSGEVEFIVLSYTDSHSYMVMYSTVNNKPLDINIDHDTKTISFKKINYNKGLIGSMAQEMYKRIRNKDITDYKIIEK